MRCENCKTKESVIKINYDHTDPEVLCRNCYIEYIMDSMRRYQDRHLIDLIHSIKILVDDVEHIPQFKHKVNW